MTRIDAALEASAMRKLMRRVVPMLAAGAVLQAFSQLNVAFAGLGMTQQLGLSATEFGFGSGIFFLSYLLLGVPANHLLLKVGARRWIAGAMFFWGLLSAALAFVTTPTQFYVLRLLVGAAEAGFIPGILYLSGSWFPEAYRGRVLSVLLVCNPLAAMLGGPLASALLQLDGVVGLAGWQWVFILGGLPATLLAPWALHALPDTVAQARWFRHDEQAWLVARLARERVKEPDTRTPLTLRVMLNREVLLFSLVFLGVSTLPFGLIFFLPKIIESFGLAASSASLLSATPFACGAALMLLWGRSSDRSGERLYHALSALAVALAGSCLYLLASGPVVGLAGLCLTFGGVFAFLPVFWTLPNRLLKISIAPMGIAVINGVGGVSGLVAPTVMGMLKDATGRYETGLACAMVAALASGWVLWSLGRSHGLHRGALARPHGEVL